MIGIYAPTVVNGNATLQTQVFYGVPQPTPNRIIVGLVRTRVIVGGA